MNDKILQLFPVPSREVSLRGLYLEHNLRAHAEALGRVFLCANFVSSLDGRIAVPDSSGKGVTLAEAITNPRDWRLFQELAVQTDILITSGRYLPRASNRKSCKSMTIHNSRTYGTGA